MPQPPELSPMPLRPPKTPAGRLVIASQQRAPLWPVLPHSPTPKGSAPCDAFLAHHQGNIRGPIAGDQFAPKGVPDIDIGVIHLTQRARF